MTPASFHRLPGDPPAPARAFWARAEDGVRLRMARWSPDEARPERRGTIFLFPGRTEYLEKYAAIGAAFASHGFAVLGIDWRGQGMSDRLQADPRPGHVVAFSDYQRDVVEMVVAAHEMDLPQPWHLLAHSMGGAIGLAALLNDLPVRSAVFSAPMWGIVPRRLTRTVANGLALAAGRLGRSGMPAPGTGGRGSFVLDCAFNDNLLTGDGQSWGRLVAEAVAWPELTLGGASYGWLGAALAECARLQAVPAADMPTPERGVLVSLGGLERVVSPAAIRTRVAGWPAARLLEVPGARHEVMFETPDRRDRFMQAALDHFSGGDG
ncbi:alpha/beta hydrolase [uncultured Paracoccus sp.]|uniref:alpha/beta hydrolase n=1 Tax=uncultured Paracoccus sp. TaxID=189685 RepID=UPI002621AFD3|nr:alpha/beta hydrolase [uncultured Paracoccus sp.]